MGLLNRRRQATGADRARTAETDPAEQSAPHEAVPGRPAYEPIRAETLSPATPEWALVPPMALSIPEMPSVVSKHFDESLVSWQPPLRFLDSLGHSVSPAAPAGVVEGLAVLVPAPTFAPEEAPIAPATPQAPLLLAPSPASRETSGRRPQATTRELAFPMMERAEAFPEPAGPGEDAAAVAPVDAGASPSETGTVTAPMPSPAADLPAGVGGEAVPAPPAQAELVGGASLIEPPRALVTSLLPAESPSRLVHAATPPELPLAQLPSAPLPQRPVPPVVLPVPAAGEPAAGDVVGLVGERAVVETSQQAGAPLVPPGAAAAPSAPAAPVGLPGSAPAAPAPAAPAAPSGDLPLASPQAGPPSEMTRVIPTPAEPVEASAPLEPPVAPTATGTDPGIGADSAPRVDLTGPGTQTEPPGDATAPLLGQGGPLAGESRSPATGASQPAVPLQAEAGPGTSQQPLTVSRPPASPRAGLGEPMSELPPTSSSWDVTKMSRSQQLQASRALIQQMNAASKLAAAALPPHISPAVPGATPGGSGQAPPGPLPLAGAGQPAPVARAQTPQSRPQPRGPVLAGADLPLAPLEPLGPPAVGVEPAGLAPSGAEYAPLLGADPLAVADGADGSEPPPASFEGQRARTVVGQRYGVDLSRVPVDRSSQGAAQATQLRARAFTSDRGVVVPPAVGTLESGPGEALLGHELTHVAQRARGGSVPTEDSVPGRALETEARAAEMALSTGVYPRPVPALPVAAPSPSSWSGVLNTAEPAHAGGNVLPLASSGSGGPDADALAETIIERLSVLSTPGARGMPGAQPAPPQPITYTAPAAPAVSGPVQRAPEETYPSSAPEPTASEEPPSPGSLDRPSDEDLSNLSRWLYPFIRYRLKGELREDRERAGLLTDHYRRW